MASYAFIQKNDGGDEVTRLCATDATPPLRLLSGATKVPAAIVVGDLIKNGNYALRVDEIVMA